MEQSTAFSAYQEKVPGLLFWQICVLGAICGIIASFSVQLGGLGGLALLVGIGRANGTQQKWLTVGVFFLAGLGGGHLSTPAPPEAPPPWYQPGTELRLSGTVTRVSGLPDRRLRILLAEVRPLDQPAATPLPGLVSWVWDQGETPDLPRPLPGQRVELTTRLRPVSGFRNPGVSDFARYWALHTVWHTAWCAAEKGKVELHGVPQRPALVREHLREATVRILGGSPPSVTGYGRRSREPGASASGNGQRMEQAQAILPALVFGDRYGLDSPTLDRFTRAGLVHSLALSGQHLAVAGLAAALVAWLVGRRFPTLFLLLPRTVLVVVLGLPLALVYLWIGNAPPSLVRAAVMLVIGAVFLLGRRVYTLLDVLLFTGLCFVVVWPQAVFDLSVQLSMLSVAGIALALPAMRTLDRVFHTWLQSTASLQTAPEPLWKRTLCRASVRLARGIVLLLCTSLAAQLATLPLVLHAFGRISPVFVLNALWLPLLGVVVLPLAMGGVLWLGLGLLLGGTWIGISESLAQWFFQAAALPAEAMIRLLYWVDTLEGLPVLTGLKPTPASALGYGLLLALAACALGRKRLGPGSKRLLVYACLLLPLGAGQREVDTLLARWENRVTLRMLDVGQGQAVLLEWPGGRLLVDGGGSASPRLDMGRDVVAPALTVNRAPRLEYVMPSHGDLDHTRGLISILKLFQVGTVLQSTLPLKSPTREEERLEAMRVRRNVPLGHVRRGDVLELGGGLALEVLHPPAQGRYSSNNGSVVLRLTRQGQGLALLCGDAEIPALRQIMRTGVTLNATVLVIPHHGSAGSLLPEFYQAVDPEIALISCGVFNRHGFPRPEVLETLTDQGIQIYNTATQGAIEVVWTKTTPFSAPTVSTVVPIP